MSGNFGGVGQQVVDNVFELGQSVTSGVAKAGVDIAKDTIETMAGAPTGAMQQQADKSVESGQSAAKQQAAQKKQEEKKQYEYVKNEMSTFIERKRQQDIQIAREKEQESKQKENNEVVEKRKKQSFVQQLLGKVAMGSHGETSKQKE
jgi:hypothetical protein